MKKTILIVIVGMLILSGLGASALNGERTHIDNTKRTDTNLPQGDELDQYQLEYTSYLGIGWFSETHPEYNMQCVQSFIPTKPVLTRVELLISRCQDRIPTQPYIVGIRDTLTGQDITTIGVDPEEISEEYTWVEFNFEDCQVISGNTYYIVSRTPNVENNTYQWGWHNTDIYPNGTSYWRIKNSDDFEDFLGDMAFKTYGRENPLLNIEFIKSGLSLSVVIKNIGEYEAIDVVWTLNITGGILDRIDKSLSGDADILPAGDEITVELPPLFGLGPLEIVATASAANAEGVIETWEGFIIFIFIV